MNNHPSSNESQSLLGLRHEKSWLSYIWQYISSESDEFMDDSISLGVKRLSNVITICLGLWLFSYIIIMIQVIDNGRRIPFTLLMFLPMWIGSIFGLISAILILRQICSKGLNLVTKERRLFMKVQINPEPDDEVTDYESLPLMRYFFLWASVFAVFILLASSTQFLFFLWYSFDIIGMWHAFIPLLVISSILIVYVYIVDTLSIWNCGLVLLLFIQVVSPFVAFGCNLSHFELFHWNVVFIV
jgi:hypothetical protein